MSVDRKLERDSPSPPNPHTRLVVLIEAHWPDLPTARWALLDGERRTVARGCGEAAEWPPAATLQVVLGGWQTCLHDIRLPRGRRGNDPRVLAYAMEDVLLQPPDTQHLTIVHRQPDGDGVRAAVLAVDRSRLHAVLDGLKAAGHAPQMLFSELELAPGPDEDWSLSLRPGATILRRGRFSAVALDADAPTPTGLDHRLLDGPLPDALAALAAEIVPGQPLRVHCEVEADEALRSIRQALPDVRIEHTSPRTWWTESDASSLLHGAFTPPVALSALSRKLRLPRALTAICLCMIGAVEFGSVLWQRHQLTGIESEMQRVFEATLPGIPPVLPLPQIERHRDDLRSKHGRLREDDFLARLATFSKARSAYPEALITTLDYDRGHLVLYVEGIADEARTGLGKMLAPQPLKAAAGMSATGSVIEILPGARK